MNAVGQHRGHIDEGVWLGLYHLVSELDLRFPFKEIKIAGVGAEWAESSSPVEKPNKVTFACSSLRSTRLKMPFSGDTNSWCRSARNV